METVLLFANKQQDALNGVTWICNDIKNTEEANHQLFFSARLMSAFMISKGETDEENKVRLTGDRELVIFPAYREDDFKRLQKSKNIVLLHNVKWICGPSEQRIERRSRIIHWLLGEEVELK